MLMAMATASAALMAVAVLVAVATAAARGALAIFDVVDLELLRSTKVLENLTVFVGYRNPHTVLLLVRPSVCVRLRSRVVRNVSTRDDKTTTVDQSICDLGMSAAANHGDRGARNAHALSGFCLAQLLQVD